MAKSASKKSGKASSSPASPPLKPKSAKDRPAGPPPPFEIPSSAFATHFLSDLPPDHIYLLHIDSTPPALKRQVFYGPVAINIAISVIILVRLYYAVPMYADLVMGILGHSSPTVVDVQALTRLNLATITLRRTLTLLGDYLLLTLFGPWPWRFVWGLEDTRYSSPVKWRDSVRFREKEIIVRRSRNWDQSLLPDWTVDDDVTLKHKIMPALERVYLARTGYSLEDQNWSLDFRAMMHAHTLVSDKTMSFRDFEKSVLVHYPASGGPLGGWMIWPITKTDDNAQTSKQRETLVRLQEKLTAMGHEDLFYRWVELVQYESNSPDGFTRDRQASAMREAKKIFEEKGIDFAQFWTEVGGMEGMAGPEASEVATT